MAGSGESSAAELPAAAEVLSPADEQPAETNFTNISDVSSEAGNDVFQELTQARVAALDAEIGASAAKDEAFQQVQQLRRECDALQEDLAAACAQRDEALALAQLLDDRLYELEQQAPAAAPASTAAPADAAALHQLREERDDAIGRRFQLQAQLDASQAEAAQLKTALASMSAALAKSTQAQDLGDESPSAGGPTREDLEMVCSVMTTEQLKEDLVQSKLALSIARSQVADKECARSDVAQELLHARLRVSQLEAACGNADALRKENAELKAALLVAQQSAAAAARARGGSVHLHAPTPTETSSPVVESATAPSDPPTPSRLARASSSSAEEGDHVGGQSTSGGALGGMMRLFGMRSPRTASAPPAAEQPPPAKLADPRPTVPSSAAALPPPHSGPATAGSGAAGRPAALRSLHRRGSGRSGSGFSDAESDDGDGAGANSPTDSQQDGVQGSR